jgi:hypothetical protein
LRLRLMHPSKATRAEMALRYSCSPPFQRMMFDLTLLWLVGLLICMSPEHVVGRLLNFVSRHGSDGCSRVHGLVRLCLRVGFLSMGLRFLMTVKVHPGATLHLPGLFLLRPVRTRLTGAPDRFGPAVPRCDLLRQEAGVEMVDRARQVVRLDAGRRERGGERGAGGGEEGRRSGGIVMGRRDKLTLVPF